mmetsp:Transcript_26765/g.62889  ORF Transcript_26765/g.62889 Transcript_26765/m.62889 type:complete len:414 (+) Transcript_26765:620-1861(+)
MQSYRTMFSLTALMRSWPFSACAQVWPFISSNRTSSLRFIGASSTTSMLIGSSSSTSPDEPERDDLSGFSESSATFRPDEAVTDPSFGASRCSGRSSRNVVPLPAPSEKARRDPPCCSAMALAKARPSPLPPPDCSLLALNWVPRSKTVWSWAGVIPTPVSTTSTTIRPHAAKLFRDPSAILNSLLILALPTSLAMVPAVVGSLNETFTVTLPLLENLRALLSRFRRTCCSRCSSPTSFRSRTFDGSIEEWVIADSTSSDSASVERSSRRSVFCLVAIILNSAVVCSTIRQIGRTSISSLKAPIWILSMLRRSLSTPTATPALLLTSSVSDDHRAKSSAVTRSSSRSPSPSAPASFLFFSRFSRLLNSWRISVSPMVTVLRGVRTSWLTNRTNFRLASSRLIFARISFRTRRS